MLELEKNQIIEAFLNEKIDALKGNIARMQDIVSESMKTRFRHRLEHLRMLKKSNERDEYQTILLNLGLEGVEIWDDYATFTHDSEEVCVETANISITATIESLLLDQVQVSCCGDILDPDYMICPTCKEHC